MVLVLKYLTVLTYEIIFTLFSGTFLKVKAKKAPSIILSIFVVIV